MTIKLALYILGGTSIALLVASLVRVGFVAYQQWKRD